jgi:hypothetical protein
VRRLKLGKALLAFKPRSSDRRPVGVLVEKVIIKWLKARNYLK